MSMSMLMVVLMVVLCVCACTIVQQNRPFNPQNIFDNLHGKVKKASVQKILDTLSGDGRIASKDFGKAKVYYALQSNAEVPPKAELDEMDSKISELSTESRELDAEIRQLQAGSYRLSCLSCSVRHAVLSCSVAVFACVGCAGGRRRE